jgi:large subunit ribosomal protein L23
MLAAMAEITTIPFITEKADRQITDNKLHFFVDTDATKPEISNEIESKFDVDVTKINTMITANGEKKAIVTLSDDDDAEDILARLGAF